MSGWAIERREHSAHLARSEVTGMAQLGEMFAKPNSLEAVVIYIAHSRAAHKATWGNTTWHFDEAGFERRHALGRARNRFLIRKETPTRHYHTDFAAKFFGARKLSIVLRLHIP